ncbi:replication-associated recombination protein A [Candidatus Nomurabacteria bacterium]|nr:replication-associated recombination protein A [Candidatus Nomurabacteria bacterium]
MSNNQPLADRMRPSKLEQYVGQEHLLGPKKILSQMLANQALNSLIFWGPPGVGKTTLAKIIAQNIKANFIESSAVLIGVPEIKVLAKTAEQDLNFFQTKTILFLDEIHRFNKAQQDVLLPYVEKGILILIGATTENPSFSINSALLSRCRVLTLEHLKKKDLEKILDLTLQDKESGLGSKKIKINDQAKNILLDFAQGDARKLLTALEIATNTTAKTINEKVIKEAIHSSILYYDKNGEEHYNIISALHKCLRDSDPDAALYWLARMLEAGEDPLYIARRLIRFASEDVGIADSHALLLAVAAKEAVHFVGLPECKLALAEAVIYLAKTKKSNALYAAYQRAAQDAQKTSHLGVPLVLRNAPSKLMKDLGYGQGYKYAPDSKSEDIKNQQHWPDDLKPQQYF